MKSMTGFGRAERSADGVRVAAQVSSVNRRNFEAVCSLPKEFQQLERMVMEKARQAIGRGRLQFSIAIADESLAASGLPGDEQLSRAVQRLKSLSESLGVPFNLDTRGLIALAELVEAESEGISEELVERLLGESVDEALAALLQMRIQEGAALKVDLKARRDNLATLTAAARAAAPGMVDKHRENLLARLEQSGLSLDAGDERVLKEVAFFADRCDISEELTRLDSHLEQYAQLLDKDEPVGRPMEFLLQEIGREINTTGSKSASIEVSRIALEMKNELERIKEQVANVE